MNARELENVLRSHGYRTRVVRDEVLVRDCPWCGNDRWNAEFNTGKGVFHAWCCDAGGRLDAFLRDRFSVDVSIPVRMDGVAGRGTIIPAEAPEHGLLPVMEVPSVFRVLQRRGLTTEDILRYGVMYATRGRMAGRIMIPILDYWSGVRLGWAGRAHGPVRPKWLHTLHRKSVCGWRSGAGSRAIHVVVEGPFDAIAVHRAGYHAAMLLGTSGPVVEWAERVSPDDVVVVMLDGDATPEAEKVAARIRMVGRKAYVVGLPSGMDPADFDPGAIRAVVGCRVDGRRSGENHVREEG